MTTDVRSLVCKDSDEMARQAADWIAGLIAAHQGSTFRIALSGGVTIAKLYRELAQRPVAWSKMQVCWIDERFVPRDHADSNYRMARENLLSSVPVPAENVFPMPTSGDPESAALAYEVTLRSLYGAEMLDRARPLFDLVLLGMGPDGHICSLLPNAPVLDERLHWVAAVLTGRPEVRLTLTYPAVQSSAVTVFYTAGQDKAATVKAVRDGDYSLPAARLQPEGSLVWILDEAAAAAL